MVKPMCSVILPEWSLASGSPQISASAILAVNANKVVPGSLCGTPQGHSKKCRRISAPMEMEQKKEKKERGVVVLRRRAKRMRLQAFRVHMLCSSLKLKKVHIPHSREEFKVLLLLAFIFKASLKSLRLILNSRSALHYFCNTHFY